MYSWMRLACTSKIDVRIDIDVRDAIDDAREPLLVGALDRAKACLELAVVGERLEPAELVEVGHPARARRFHRAGSASPGFAISSHRRCVTPLVLLLKRSGQSS